MSQLNIADLNMDTTTFGFQNSIPYSNTKCMLALLTKELGKRNGINAYALCQGIVNTQIFEDTPFLTRLAMRTLLYLSTFPDEVI